MVVVHIPQCIALSAKPKISPEAGTLRASRDGIHVTCKPAWRAAARTTHALEFQPHAQKFLPPRKPPQFLIRQAHLSIHNKPEAPRKSGRSVSIPTAILSFAQPQKTSAARVGASFRQDADGRV